MMKRRRKPEAVPVETANSRSFNKFKTGEVNLVGNPRDDESDSNSEETNSDSNSSSYSHEIAKRLRAIRAKKAVARQKKKKKEKKRKHDPLFTQQDPTPAQTETANSNPKCTDEVSPIHAIPLRTFFNSEDDEPPNFQEDPPPAVVLSSSDHQESVEDAMLGGAEDQNVEPTISEPQPNVQTEQRLEANLMDGIEKTNSGQDKSNDQGQTAAPKSSNSTPKGESAAHTFISLEEFEKLEKEDPLAALDNFVNRFMNTPHPSSASSAVNSGLSAASSAELILKEFKEKAFTYDLTEVMKDNPGFSHELLGLIKRVEGLRVGNSITSFLLEFEHNFSQVDRSFRMRFKAQENLSDKKGVQAEYVENIANTRAEVEEEKSKIAEADTELAKADKDIEDLLKQIEMIKAKKASISDLRAKAVESMNQKTQTAISHVKEVYGLNATIQALENEYSTSCRRFDMAYQKYWELEGKCPF
ncbi:hypothetical protein OROMI_001495 [Orobanche minor]